MNSLSGHISELQVSGSLSLVSVIVHETITIKAIIIETPETAPYLKINHPIKVLFKETEVVIGTDENHNISLQNRISGKVKSIERGALLSRLTVQSEVGEITAIISAAAVDELKLKSGVTVMAMIKLNEIMISEK